MVFQRNKSSKFSIDFVWFFFRWIIFNDYIIEYYTAFGLSGSLSIYCIFYGRLDIIEESPFNCMFRNQFEIINANFSILDETKKIVINLSVKSKLIYQKINTILQLDKRPKWHVLTQINSVVMFSSLQNHCFCSCLTIYQFQPSSFFHFNKSMIDLWQRNWILINNFILSGKVLRNTG